MLITFLIRHINVYFLVVPAVSSLFFFFWLAIFRQKAKRIFKKDAKIKYFLRFFTSRIQQKNLIFFQISIHGSGR